MRKIHIKDKRIDLSTAIVMGILNITDNSFYDGDQFPEWNNNLLATSLKFERLHRIELDGLNMVKDEIIFEAGSRVRDVEVGPDGMIYVALEDPGRIVKLTRYSK